MNERVLLIILLMTPFLIIPVSAAEHTIQFQNHCSYDVAVSIVGGLQYKPAGSTMVYSACQCMADTTCVPTTMCNYTACGTNNMNKCDQGTPLVDNGGFLLDADTRAGAQTTHTISVPKFWQGSFQPRSNCHNDSAGNYVCDYEQHTCRAYQDGQGKIQCGGHGITDAIKGEINFDENGVDTYDVSAVDGFNIPVTIELVPGTYTAEGLTPAAYACTKSGTDYDLKAQIGVGNWSNLSTDKLVVKNSAGNAITVRSACSYASALNHKNNPVFDEKDLLTNETCCKLPWGSAQDYTKNGNIKCDPSGWPEDINTAAFFKYYLPPAYSYAYDDHTSTYTCKNKDESTLTRYVVTFCGADEGTRTGLPGTTDHVHVSDIGDPQVVTPALTATPVPAQTPVTGRYNPTGSGSPNF